MNLQYNTNPQHQRRQKEVIIHDRQHTLSLTLQMHLEGGGARGLFKRLIFHKMVRFTSINDHSPSVRKQWRYRICISTCVLYLVSFWNKNKSRRMVVPTLCWVRHVRPHLPCPSHTCNTCWSHSRPQVGQALRHGPTWRIRTTAPYS